MTSSSRTFAPDWCIAPGETLREWMQENHLPLPVLATASSGRANRDEAMKLIQQVLDRKHLRKRHALVLETGTGITAKFWLALELNYRTALAAGKKDVSE